MKNASKHAQQLKSLLKKLGKPPQGPGQMDPIRALVLASFAYDATDAQALAVLAKADQQYVDFNELRVATELELFELLGTRYPGVDRRVGAIHDPLQAIFDREHALRLDRVQNELKKAEQRQFVMELTGINAFQAGFLLMYGLNHPSMPLDETMLGFLVESGVLEEDATEFEAQKWLESNLKADEIEPAYLQIRAASEGFKSKKPAKKVVAKKAKK